MNRVYYCDEINALVIAHTESIHSDSGFIVTPIEWGHKDIVEAQRVRAKRVQKMAPSCDLFDLFDWEYIGEW